MAISREQILQANDRACETEDVPQWGGKIYVWEMSEKQRGDFEAWTDGDAEKKDYSVFAAKLVAMTVGDESGLLTFSRDDVGALVEKSSLIVRRLSKTALKLNKMRKEDDEAALKNSSSGPEGSPPSGSPPSSDTST